MDADFDVGTLINVNHDAPNNDQLQLNTALDIFPFIIDGNGILWSASISQNRLLRYDPATRTGTCVFVLSSYGLGIDPLGFIWNSQWTRNSLVKVSSGGAGPVIRPVPRVAAGRCICYAAPRGLTVDS